MSWLGIPPHVQKSSSRFSCLCAFVPALPPERALRLSCFRAVVSRALSEGRCDRRACVAEIIRTSTETCNFECSFEVNLSYERTSRQIVCRLSELVESVRRVGVTTSGVVNPNGPPSTVNCRRGGVELSSGRCAVDNVQSVNVAVVWSPTAVPRRRRCQAWCRRPWTPRGHTDVEAKGSTARRL